MSVSAKTVGDRRSNRWRCGTGAGPVVVVVVVGRATVSEAAETLWAEIASLKSNQPRSTSITHDREAIATHATPHTIHMTLVHPMV